MKDTYHKTLSDGDRLLQIQGFGETFGPKSQRKRPTLTNMGISETYMQAEQEEKGADLANLFTSAAERGAGY